MAASASLITQDISELESKTGNIYKSINVMARRSRQVSVKVKQELTSKLAEFASHVDNLEEIFENREQIEISRYYERLPKPTSVVVSDFKEDKIFFKNKEEDV